MSLKIKLRPNEKVFVNGAVVSAGDQGVVLYFLNSARILMEKDILAAGNVVGPEKRLYFILQLIYIDPSEQASYAQHLPPLMEELMRKYPDKGDDLELVLELAVKGDLYKAMKVVKKTFHIEIGSTED